MSGRGKKKQGKAQRRSEGAGPEARRRASAILEVLAGALSPTAAAEVLGCSPARYYGIESQALDGLLAACEPRPVGYAHTPERELEALKKAHAKLERELARYQALCRAAQRTAGLSASKVKQAKERPGKRKRKPTVRALKLAKQLKAGAGPAKAEGERHEQGKTG